MTETLAAAPYSEIQSLSEAFWSVEHTAEWAFQRYEAARARLPAAQFSKSALPVTGLRDLVGDHDTFVLDAFGVINVGTSAVPGALEAVSALQALGKRVIVLTNGASVTREQAAEKYRGLGFAFGAEDVVSSRDVTVAALADYPPETLWGVAAPDFARIEMLARNVIPLKDDRDAYDRAEALLFLSSWDWSPARQTLLHASLKANPRPLVIGNPDVVAPHEAQFSIEPGLFAHAMADDTGVAPHFCGKPFKNAFDAVAAQVAATGAPLVPQRTVMVGDTLHTDILGGAAAGLKTLLLTGYGLFRGLDVAPFIARSGVVPDYIAEGP
ncbi:MAG: HAD-IIA family hydrolase [Pseudomonadota bacterium]